MRYIPDSCAACEWRQFTFTFTNMHKHYPPSSPATFSVLRAARPYLSYSLSSHSASSRVHFYPHSSKTQPGKCREAYVFLQAARGELTCRSHHTTQIKIKVEGFSRVLRKSLQFDLRYTLSRTRQKIKMSLFSFKVEGMLITE
jgi:hypothetical protein